MTDRPLETPGVSVSSLAFSPDCMILATGGKNGLLLWDVVERRLLTQRPIDIPEGSILGIAFSPDGKILATGHYGLDSKAFDEGSFRGVALWNVARLRRPTERPDLPKGQVASRIDFSPDGKTLVAIAGNRLALWDVFRRRRLSEWSLENAGNSFSGVTFSPDGKTLAVGAGAIFYSQSSESGVWLWDVAGRRLTERPLDTPSGSCPTLPSMLKVPSWPPVSPQAV